VGTAPTDSDSPGDLVLDGVWIGGNLTVTDGMLGGLSLWHSTVNPTIGTIAVAAGNPMLALALDRSIAGDMTIGPLIKALRITGSVVGAIANTSAALEICDSTAFGPVSAQTLEASGAIFTEPVVTAQLQTGCVRYCWIAPNSVTPRPFRCQPQLGLTGVPAAQHASIVARLRPGFTSVRCGDPGFAQLARSTAAEIAQGGEDGTEMGAFRFLAQPARQSNLRNLLPDYLPYGLEYGLFFET
jgi:hypothetical protein